MILQATYSYLRITGVKPLIPPQMEVECQLMTAVTTTQKSDNLSSYKSYNIEMKELGKIAMKQPATLQNPYL